MRLRLFAIGIVLLVPHVAHASPLTLRYRHFLFSVSAKTVDSWAAPGETWQWQGRPISPPQALRVDGDRVPPLPAGMTRVSSPSFDPSRIARTLEKDIAPSLAREAGTVTISRNASGAVVFDGVGMPGRAVDTRKSADVIAQALAMGVSDIVLVVEEPAPTVTVNDAELRSQGITGFVTIGESDFSGSTENRKHNVRTGLNKFNGHLIPKDSVFSFDETLGRVDASTGYRKELTILGDKTLPDFGGGLCQVSTTAYRGVWEAGFPITQRRNHSYAVHYYSPQGTDATIYPPNTDMKFKNDSPGALLMQTFTEGTRAYFLYYGTPFVRQTTVVGPFTWNHSSPPPPKTEYTTDLAPGEKKKVGEAVPGMNAAWYRFIATGTGHTVEPVLSIYQARPLFYQIGGADPAGSGAVLPAGDAALDPSA